MADRTSGVAALGQVGARVEEGARATLAQKTAGPETGAGEGECVRKAKAKLSSRPQPPVGVRILPPPSVSPGWEGLGVVGNGGGKGGEGGCGARVAGQCHPPPSATSGRRPHLLPRPIHPPFHIAHNATQPTSSSPFPPIPWPSPGPLLTSSRPLHPSLPAASSAKFQGPTFPWENKLEGWQSNCDAAQKVTYHCVGLA